MEQGREDYIKNLHTRYGGNGSVFQNWAQYHLVMKYLSEMTDEQTLVMYSGHPLGYVLFSLKRKRIGKEKG
jgi:urocanate hydratase